MSDSSSDNDIDLDYGQGYEDLKKGKDKERKKEYAPLGASSNGTDDALLAEYERRSYSENDRLILGLFKNATPHVTKVAMDLMNRAREQCDAAEYEQVFNILRSTVVRIRPSAALDPRFVSLGTASVALTPSGMKESVLQFLTKAANMATFDEDGALKTAPLGFWKESHSGNNWAMEIWHFQDAMPMTRDTTPGLDPVAKRQGNCALERWAKDVAPVFLKNHEEQQPEKFTGIMKSVFNIIRNNHRENPRVALSVRLELKPELRHSTYLDKLPAGIKNLHGKTINLEKWTDKQIATAADIEYWIDHAQPGLFDKLRAAFRELDDKLVVEIKQLYDITYNQGSSDMFKRQRDELNKLRSADAVTPAHSKALQTSWKEFVAESVDSQQILQERRIADAEKPAQDYLAKRCLSAMPSHLDRAAPKLEYVLSTHAGHFVERSILMVTSGKEPDSVHMVGQIVNTTDVQVLVPGHTSNKVLKRMELDQLDPVAMEKHPADYIVKSKKELLVFDYAIPFEVKARRDPEKVIKTWTRYPENAELWETVVLSYLANPSLKAAVIKTYFPCSDNPANKKAVMEQYYKTIKQLFAAGATTVRATPQLHNAEFYILHRKVETSRDPVQVICAQVDAFNRLARMAKICGKANVIRQNLMIFGNRLYQELEVYKISHIPDIRKLMPHSFAWEWIKKRVIPPIDRDLMTKHTRKREEVMDVHKLFSEERLFTPIEDEQDAVELEEFPTIEKEVEAISNDNSITAMPSGDAFKVMELLRSAKKPVTGKELAQQARATSASSKWDKKRANRALSILNKMGLIKSVEIEGRNSWTLEESRKKNE